jgi:hypothetical protein
MKTILVINDDSTAAEHAAKFALAIAQRMGADLLLANTYIHNNKAIEKILAALPGHEKSLAEEAQHDGITGRLKQLNEEQTGFRPNITELDVSAMDEARVAEMINKTDTWMMVKGIADNGGVSFSTLDVQKVLNRVRCPLMLVPGHWQLKNMERLVYIADLRYCRLEIVRYLAELARPWKADLSIAHLSASGLPDMGEKYALSVFNEAISRNVNYDQLFFNNIKEKELVTAVDVMINGLHNDLLVVVNHRFHFERIIGYKIIDTLPAHITVPLLIFPY